MMQFRLAVEEICKPREGEICLGFSIQAGALMKSKTEKAIVTGRSQSGPS
jgi:hypothetical protein